MEDNLKIVHFDQYCPTCKHEKKTEREHPCDECLIVPANVNTHQPVRWEEKSER